MSIGLSMLVMHKEGKKKCHSYLAQAHFISQDAIQAILP